MRFAFHPPTTNCRFVSWVRGWGQQGHERPFPSLVSICYTMNGHVFKVHYYFHKVLPHVFLSIPNKPAPQQALTSLSPLRSFKHTNLLYQPPPSCLCAFTRTTPHPSPFLQPYENNIIYKKKLNVQSYKHNFTFSHT